VSIGVDVIENLFKHGLLDEMLSLESSHSGMRGFWRVRSWMLMRRVVCGNDTVQSKPETQREKPFTPVPVQT